MGTLYRILFKDFKVRNTLACQYRETYVCLLATIYVAIRYVLVNRARIHQTLESPYTA